MIRIDVMFNKNPFLTISGIFKKPEPKTIAFGGVATGNINAHEADTEAATINTNGCKSNSRQMGAKMGSIIAMVAIFEAISVKKLTTVANKISKKKRFNVPKTEI